MVRILYYTQRSPYARKVRIILAEKQLPCELKQTDINNKSQEFLILTPIGKVPVLVDENGLVFWDSTLIVEYLDETYPQPGFYPSDRIERLCCRQGEELADSLIDNVVGLWYETRKGNQADFDTQAKYQSSINRVLSVFEQKLTVSAYLFNETPSAVDVAAISGLGYYSLRFGNSWQQEYPKLSQWFEVLHQRQSVYSTMPKA
ncbi:glutathione S-transferase family protein [Tolypothrix sp. PCC 7910]|uniref:glutathione S-transferase family protein n=1 Tax=Tolypothrix sp. PCC 7910 TaxID=2099387 RepID=UPI0014278CA3|nr:glutathione S-transferase family protein [Tolypothrix sp. PCC 7910]QIR37193.1 glutathione S-transferase family protein [Tolypothrix sp. PCC 7910]